jgi:hypothetical protein
MDLSPLIEAIAAYDARIGRKGLVAARAASSKAG